MKLRPKNQLTLPARIVRRYGFHAGDAVEFVEQKDGVLVKPGPAGKKPLISSKTLRGAWTFPGGYKAAMKMLRD